MLISIDYADSQSAVGVYTSLPWLDIGVALFISLTGGTLGRVMTVVHESPEPAIPWWAHACMALGAGFIATALLAGH